MPSRFYLFLCFLGNKTKICHIRKWVCGYWKLCGSFNAKNFIFRVKKSSIACSKSRDYGSSGPVRYIPKKSSKINKLENGQLPKDSKKKEDCKLSDTSALVNEIRYDGSGEEKNIYFGEKPRYKRRPASILPFSVSEKGINANTET